MSNETVEQYIEYVKSQLETISQADAVASYDTGYGLHIVCEQLGDECHAMDVLAHSILKVRPPRIDGDFDTWEIAWKQGKQIVNQFCSKVGKQ